MSKNTHQLIDFLMLEHSNHGGRENGNLKATHNQLASYGLTPCNICDAVDEAEALGLVRAVRGGRRNLSNQPSIFRLTWIGDKHYAPPTNEWKGVTAEGIEKWKSERAAQRKNKRLRNQKKKHASRGTEPLNLVVSDSKSAGGAST